MAWINILAIVRKDAFLKLLLNIQKELHELHNNYPSAPEEKEIKKEMLSKYQLKTADLYNISTGNVKRLVPNLFDKEKCVLHYEKLQLYFKIN